MLSAYSSWNPLDRCVWRTNIIVWHGSYFRHSNNIDPAKVSLQKLLMELQYKWKLHSLYGKQRTKMTASSFCSIRHAHWIWFCLPVFFLRKNQHGGAGFKASNRQVFAKKTFGQLWKLQINNLGKGFLIRPGGREDAGKNSKN